MTIKDLKLNGIGLKALIVFLFFCPIFYDPQMFLSAVSLRINQEQFFQLGALVLFTLVTLENVYLAFFLLWAVVIYAYYGFPSVAGTQVLNIFFGCVIFQTAYKLINKDNVDKVFKIILWLCVLNIVWISLQFLKTDLIFLRKGEYTTDLVGLLGLKCFMGMFFALAVPIFAYFNWRLSLLFFIPIYFSESSVAVVGGVVGLLFVVFFKSKKIFLALLLAFSILGACFVARDTQTGMFEGRFKMWQVVLRDAFKHPVMGWGIDSFRSIGKFKPFIYMQNAMTLETKAIPMSTLQVYHQTGQFPPMPGFIKEGDALDPWDNPHNEYIMLFYEYGLIGLIIIGALCRDIVRKFIPTPEVISIMAVFIVFLIISTGQFPFHVVRLGYLAPVMLGAYYKLIKDQTIGDVRYGS